jgi:hypothetical protein
MQTRKEIDRGAIKLAIDMLADIDDPAVEHILGVLIDCGNEIARLRVENDVLKERERTNDTLLTEQGDKLDALNDELTELRAFKAACEGRRDMAEKAVIEQCMLAESCWVEGNIRKTLKNLCEYWFSAGTDEQQSVLETALVLDLRQQIAKLTEQVAEACAKACDDLADCEQNTDAYRAGAHWCREIIRCGEWRKFMEGKS